VTAAQAGLADSDRGAVAQMGPCAREDAPLESRRHTPRTDKPAGPPKLGMRRLRGLNIASGDMDRFTPWPTIWQRRLAYSQQISRQNALAAARALTRRRLEREEVERELSTST
jgi:hypothetical protein